MKINHVHGALAALALLAACGGSDDQDRPTASDNAHLDQIAEELDTSADSLALNDAALGNGEEAQTGEVLVSDEGNGADANAAR